MIQNNKLQLCIAPDGYVSSLTMIEDTHKMNWVIDEKYLSMNGYQNKEKLFGQFTITINHSLFESVNVNALITEKQNQIEVKYVLNQVEVVMIYNTDDEQCLLWDIELRNLTNELVTIQNFGVWASFANVMFRDKDVLENIHHSAAVFPSISTNYTKMNAVRRSNQDGNIGIYQQKGETLSVGTFCDYENLFFENVSPSLDGMIFHQLLLATSDKNLNENNDWIYKTKEIQLKPNASQLWQYQLTKNRDQEDFYEQALQVGHPVIQYEPLTILGQTTRIAIQHKGKQLEKVVVRFKNNEITTEEISFQTTESCSIINYKPGEYGEHQLIIQLDDGTEDFIVFNVMAPIAEIIENRVAYICDELYNGPTGKIPYAFNPISNQGESLGKLNVVLQKNRLGIINEEQVRMVEASAVHYVKQKWFVNGDFRTPQNLYGDFYRCMDFEYIGHLFYLLSEFNDDILVLNSAETYLQWAAEVFELRINPDWHDTERGKEEAQMLGVYFLYADELLKKLLRHGYVEIHRELDGLWSSITKKINEKSISYEAAVTEHFYDNAGFGPTAGALSIAGLTTGAKRYGELLLANIGYSNDFRAQNPDRWWEALAYMIHSLWGGLTAAASYQVYEHLEDIEYLAASYRATVGVLYCYDTNATATTPLEKGMAASTYAVAGPHLNRPDLSRARFGQATFYQDGGIFSRLFENDTQTPDWDMGEELVAYLESFGQQTFIIQQNQDICVINGTYEEQGSDLLITSYAPYSKKFWLIKDGQRKLLADEPGKQTVLLELPLQV